MKVARQHVSSRLPAGPGHAGAKPLGAGVLGVVEHVRGGAAFDHCPAVQHDRFVGELAHDGQVVADQDVGDRDARDRGDRNGGVAQDVPPDHVTGRDPAADRRLHVLTVALLAVASDAAARATAGRVKCRTLLRKSVPPPSAGNQRSLTANSKISTIAAMNAGIAAETAVTTSVVVSSRPGRSPDTTPRPTPRITMIRDAYRTSPAVVQIRDAINVDTFARTAIEIPRFPCSTLSSQYQYWARNGSFRW